MPLALAMILAWPLTPSRAALPPAGDGEPGVAERVHDPVADGGCVHADRVAVEVDAVGDDRRGDEGGGDACWRPVRPAPSAPPAGSCPRGRRPARCSRSWLAAHREVPRAVRAYAVAIPPSATSRSSRAGRRRAAARNGSRSSAACRGRPGPPVPRRGQAFAGAGPQDVDSGAGRDGLAQVHPGRAGGFPGGGRLLQGPPRRAARTCPAAARKRRALAIIHPASATSQPPRWPASIADSSHCRPPGCPALRATASCQPTGAKSA